MFIPRYTISDKINSLSIDISNLILLIEIENKRNLHLRKENRIRTIYSTLAIENNSLSIEDVSDIINGKKVLGPLKDIKEVQNAYEAYDNVFRYNPYEIKDFLSVHKLMMDELFKESGKFRSKDVAIYDAKGNILHIGCSPEFVNDLVLNLFRWEENSTAHPLIKSSIIHFELEIIHPFSDGNGRMGRIWQNLILSKWNKLFE